MHGIVSGQFMQDETSVLDQTRIMINEPSFRKPIPWDHHGATRVKSRLESVVSNLLIVHNNEDQENWSSNSSDHLLQLEVMKSSGPVGYALSKGNECGWMTIESSKTTIRYDMPMYQWHFYSVC